MGFLPRAFRTHTAEQTVKMCFSSNNTITTHKPAMPIRSKLARLRAICSGTPKEISDSTTIETGSSKIPSSPPVLPPISDLGHAAQVWDPTHPRLSINPKELGIAMADPDHVRHASHWQEAPSNRRHSDEMYYSASAWQGQAHICHRVWEDCYRRLGECQELERENERLRDVEERLRVQGEQFGMVLKRNCELEGEVKKYKRRAGENKEMLYAVLKVHSSSKVALKKEVAWLTSENLRYLERLKVYQERLAAGTWIHGAAEMLEEHAQWVLDVTRGYAEKLEQSREGGGEVKVGQGGGSAGEEESKHDGAKIVRLIAQA